jgi:outer membrane biosynthesis protein TonB
VSKAKPYPAADEEASTALAGGEWGDEASTTIEHGQVAAKLAPLPPTKPGAPPPGAINGANGSVTQTGTGLEDHTVDDQHVREVLSAITPIRPDAVARLVITAGNDAGRDVEIQPGKTYTIGRAIDNDVVLTDISVSRKHFDIKHEDGAWVIVDRGSGNGTVVNGNLEDNPFMLATGDVIEIGNTVFRFEQPNGAPRPSGSTYDLEDEELSTVAGKPMRDDEPPPPLPTMRPAPRSVPPPAPLPPPLAPVLPHAAAMRPTSRSTPPPLAAFAAAQQGLPPLPSPASTLPMAQMANRAPLGAPGAQTIIGDAMGMPLGQPHPANMGSTLQGQPPPGRPSFPYPQAAEIPPHSVHAQMLLIQQQGVRRGDGSTAHVPPVPYNPMVMGGAPSRGYGVPQLSRRTKLLIGGIALAVLTGVVTAAIVKSSDTPKTSASAKADKRDAKGTAPTTNKMTVKTEAKPKQEPPRPTVEPIKQEPKLATVPAPTPEAPKQEPPRVTTVEPPKQEPPKVATVEPPKQEPKQEPKVVKQEPKVVKQEPKRESRDKRRETPRRETPPKRVAAAVDIDDAEDKADGLYRDRNFNGAAKVLSDAARSADEDDAKQLRLKAERYIQLGKTFAQGTAPAQKAHVAFEFLQQASNYDRNVGNAFDAEIQQKLAAVAPKAAASYLAQAQYAKARTALIQAQRLGSSDSTLPVVKQKLEAVAGELYNEASKEMSSNPTSAREKLKTLKTYVDPKSSWAQKADALLKKG